METNIISQPPIRNTSLVLTGTPSGYAQATISGTAANLPSIPTGANRALVQIETTDSIRWRDDGIAPTTSIGFILYNANIIELTHPQSISNFQAIAMNSSVTLNVCYYVR